MFSYLSPLYIVNISPLLDVKFVKNLVLFYMLPLFPDDGVLQHAGGIELHVVSFNNFISRAYANGFLVRDFFFLYQRVLAYSSLSLLSGSGCLVLC